MKVEFVKILSKNKIKDKIDEKLGSEIKHVSQVDNFLNDLITSKYISPKYSNNLFSSSGKLIICRDWNSYYPSFYDVKGGCYVIYYKGKYTVIDPGYRAIRVLFEKKIDTRMIQNVIITHDHADHIGGLRELLDLLYRQNKNIAQECKLFVNPGAYREYQHFSNDNLEVIEIILEDEVILKQELENCRVKEKFSFIGHSIHHTGINREQTSIGLTFNIAKNQDILKFGITSDLDGKEEYIKEYKTKFDDLYFLITHLGSLKYKNSQEKKDKHLYPDGLYRLIDNLDNVKAFVIQEFGLELASPKKLSNILSDIVFHNGFYFPYLVFSLLNQENSEEIRQILIPDMLNKFFELFNKNLKEKIVQFSCVLCLDLSTSSFDDIDNSLIDIDFLNMWDSDELDEEALSGISELFNAFWGELCDNVYYRKRKSTMDLEDYCKKLNKLLNQKNFCENILENSRLLLSNSPPETRDKFLETIEILFYRKNIIGSFGPYAFIYDKYYIDFIPNLLRFPLTPKYFFLSSLKRSQMRLLVFPFLIFIYALYEFDSFKSTYTPEIQEKLLNSFKEFFPEKKIYLGSYGSEIEFNTYFEPYMNQKLMGRCRKCFYSAECKNPKDGKYLFRMYRKCTLDEQEDLENDWTDLSHEQENYEITVEEINQQREYEEEIKKSKRLNYKLFECFLSKDKFEDAYKVLFLKHMRPFLEFDLEYVNYLKPNLDNDSVKQILFLFFTMPLFTQKSIPANIALLELIYKIIEDEILNTRIEYLGILLKNIHHYLKFRFQNIFSTDTPEFKELKVQFVKILGLILQYLISENEFSWLWTERFNYVRDIFAAIKDEEILIELRYIIERDFKFDINNREKQLRQLRYKFISVDKVLLSIFKNKF